MAQHHELLLSSSDAEVLSFILGEYRRRFPLETEEVDALADLLDECRRVRHDTSG